MIFFLRIFVSRLLIAVAAFLGFIGIDTSLHQYANQEISDINKIIENRDDIVSDFIKGTNETESISESINNSNTDSSSHSDSDSTTDSLIKIVSDISNELLSPDTQSSPSSPSSPVSTNSPETSENTNEPTSNTYQDTDTVTADASNIASNLEDAVVNLTCVNKTINLISVINGSGVVISPDGLILTNAHVAQNFLIDEYGKKYQGYCEVRSKKNPSIGFKSSVIYINPDWIEENYETINQQHAKGTGENDYALILVDPNFSGVPKSFKYVNVDANKSSIKIGAPITAIGYPGVQKSVFDLNSLSRLASDDTRIQEVYTFNKTTIDVFSTDETDVARQGASGGGIFRDNKLIGLTVTTTGGSRNGLDKINALTMEYVNRDIKEDTGLELYDIINSSDKSGLSIISQNTLLTLTALIESIL